MIYRGEFKLISISNDKSLKSLLTKYNSEWSLIEHVCVNNLKFKKKKILYKQRVH